MTMGTGSVDPLVFPYATPTEALGSVAVLAVHFVLYLGCGPDRLDRAGTAEVS